MRSGYVAPITFGVISANTMMRNEITERADGVGELVVAEQAHRDQAGERARRGDDQRVADEDAAEQPVGALEQLGHAHRAASRPARTRCFRR